MTCPSHSRKQAQPQRRPDPLRLLHLLQRETGPAAAGPARILVVDDDGRFRQSMVTMLEMAGYRCLAAAGGDEAVRLLAEQEPDLVLLDLLMPGMDGHQVLDRLRALDREVGIIIISVDTTWDSLRQTLRRGADNFIRKPYAPDEVLAAIESCLQKRELRRQNRRMLQQRQVSEQLHRFLVNHSPDCIFILDTEGIIRFANRKMHSLLGYPREGLLDRPFATLVADPAGIDCAAAGGGGGGARKRVTLDVELKKRCRAGEAGHELIPAELTLMAVTCRDASGGGRVACGMYGVARDITERKKAEALISFQAHHDQLTGLPNRVLLNDRLDLAIRQAQRDGGRLAVLFVDLDRFKMVNDTLGHAQGDLLLQAVARRIANCVRRGDTLSRIGGDEFVLLVPRLKLKKDASRCAEGILEILRAPFMLGVHEVFVRASIGIAVYPDHGDTPEELLRHADMAMYAIKEKGRDDVAFYHPGLDRRYARRLSMESELRNGLANNEFVLEYQPQVNMGDGSLRGLEALIRWDHPARGRLLPTEFIPWAEENGLIVPLGNWVLQQVFVDIRRWKRQGVSPPLVAVNISSLQLHQPSFLGFLVDLLEEHDIDGTSMELEITENIIMNDASGAIRRLSRLTDIGVRVAIDDFGTGYSSLSYLQRLPVTTLKIDQSFIRRIGPGSSEDSIVSAIVAMARSLGLGLIAEGVEQELQARYLGRIGCHLAQGYLFASPLGHDETGRYLSRKSA